jgi:hypothetical protein
MDQVTLILKNNLFVTQSVFLTLKAIRFRVKEMFDDGTCISSDFGIKFTAETRTLYWTMKMSD